MCNNRRRHALLCIYSDSIYTCICIGFGYTYIGLAIEAHYVYSSTVTAHYVHGSTLSTTGSPSTITVAFTMTDCSTDGHSLGAIGASRRYVLWMYYGFECEPLAGNLAESL